MFWSISFQVLHGRYNTSYQNTRINSRVFRYNRTNMSSFYSELQKTKSPLPIKLHLCFVCLWNFKVIFSCLFFGFSPILVKQSHQNQINSIIPQLGGKKKKKTKLISCPLTSYTSPVFATNFLLFFTVRFPERFFYTNCLHFPRFQFTLQPELPDVRLHHSSETAVVKVNNLALPDAIDALPSSPFWVLRQQRTDNFLLQSLSSMVPRTPRCPNFLLSHHFLIALHAFSF